MRRRKRGGCLLPVLMLALAAFAVVFSLRRMGVDILQRPMSREEYAGFVRERARETIPYFDRRYYLTSLDDETLDAAVTVYESAMDFDRECRFVRQVGRESFSVALTVLGAECPELMQLDLTDASTYMYNKLTGSVSSFRPPYCMDEAEYNSLRDECESAIGSMLEGTEGMSETEIEKLVFDHIADFCVYDVDTELSSAAAGALVEGRAKCDGISAAFKWAMEEAGFTCLSVSADIPGNDVGHAWNVLNIDGEWYRVDVTQSVRNYEQENLAFPEPIYYAFNISDSIPRTEYIVSENLLKAAPLPECTSMDKSAYAERGTLVRKGEDGESRLRRELEKVLRPGGGAVALQFEDDPEFDAVSKRVRNIVADVLNNRPQRYMVRYIISDEYNVFAAVAMDD